MAMERTWTLSGTYANWTLTVSAEPPETESGDFDVPEWPGEKFDPVAAHFLQAVNYYEVSRDSERFYG
jgi:hypothetical protein